MDDEELRGKNFEGKLDQCFFPEETQDAQNNQCPTILRTSTVIEETMVMDSQQQTSEAIQTQESYYEKRSADNRDDIS